MANVRFFVGVDMSAADISNLQFITPTIETSTHFRGDDRTLGFPNEVTDVFGTNFTYDKNGLPAGGTIEEWDSSTHNGSPAYSVTNISFAVNEFMSFVNSGDTQGLFAHAQE